jgi:hypothetical protein
MALKKPFAQGGIMTVMRDEKIKPLKEKPLAEQVV